jgi:predicted dehydrogenase
MTQRRDFLKFTGLVSAGILSDFINPALGSPIAQVRQTPERPNTDRFNMSGYAAPRLETVKIGFVGLGNRGPAAVERMSFIEGAEIKALCDIRPEKVNAVKKKLEGSTHQPEVYTGEPDAWKKLCEQKDLDLVYIAAPWALHTPIAVYAMKQGKHVCVEVPAAKTIDECWQLVETSESTRKHCMMLENCCYDFFELLTLNMVRQGILGDIVHGEGGYIHFLLDQNFSEYYYDHWRLKENLRNGNLYPTHGLGPVAQLMNINRGDRMEALVSRQSNDFSMHAKAVSLAATDSFYAAYTDKKFRGNMNTTSILTSQGRTIMLQHDVSSPNVYSRIYKISGTKGSVLKYPLPGKIAIGHENWLTADEYDKMENTYSPPIIKKIGEMAKQVGGHGGMDFLMDWHTIDCLRNGLPLDMDVYDAAAWSAVAPLSEWSVANEAKPIAIPDFTRGNWKTNKPVDISLEKGGNTGIRK